jgi:hypothetical protein
LPNAILAKAAKKGTPPAAFVAQLSKNNPSPAEKPAPAITGWSTVTTAVATAVASAPTGGSSPAEAEGRMALAGPTVPPAAASPASAAKPASAAPAPRVVQGGQGSWTRSMMARRFESLN